MRLYLLTIMVFGLCNSALAHHEEIMDSANSQNNTNVSSQVDDYKNETLNSQPDADGDPSVNNYQGVINSAEVVAFTLAADPLSCLQWAPIGGCLWMTCTLLGCSFSTSVKVENYVSDLIVQSYDRANGEPWTESQTINQVAQGDADSSIVSEIISLVTDFDVSSVGIEGGVSTEGNKNQHANLMFKLVDAYGSPGGAAYLAANGTGFICSGNTIPLFPYYISNLDAVSWRWNVLEMFYYQSWDVFSKSFNLGGWTNDYGAVYPRHGFLTQTDPVKAAVLSAYRAAHFITRDNQMHLYVPITKSNGKGYWPPSGLEYTSDSTGRWQMLYPQQDAGCASFPYSTNPSERTASDGNYVWNLWRKHKCCQRNGSSLIDHTEF